MKNFLYIGFFLIIAGLGACASTSSDYTANMVGASDYSTVAVKDFKSLGIITVFAQETHYSGPLGIKKSVEGSKITFADLMQEAAKLEADDIINIRIDMNTNYSKGGAAWFTGWTKTYTYTATALAIKYTDKLETETGDSQLSGLPKTPEHTKAVKTTKDGKVILR